ncbi:hypothetical protein MTP99_011745 [Tenebrio molitor]|jgi:hypothetical protein|nr:hypothetical protein MTP99_011745 [Tenebrio molitor]
MVIQVSAGSRSGERATKALLQRYCGNSEGSPAEPCGEQSSPKHRVRSSADQGVESDRLQAPKFGTLFHFDEGPELMSTVEIFGRREARP